MKAALVLALLTACTTLGPMPATTGISAVPAGRSALEAQAAVMPAYFLSQSAQDQPAAAPIPQASVLVEPGSSGLIAGGRVYGGDPDNAVEPFIGIRRSVDPDEDVSIAAIAYGTEQHAGQSQASYRADRVGGELALDLRWWHPVSWLSAHVQGTVAATRIDASGTYCVGDDGKAIDCSNDTPNKFVDGSIHGLFPSATGAIAVDIGRNKTHLFNGVRIALMMATGRMPLLVDGRQDGTGVYYQAGMSITLGLGGH